MQQSGNKPKKGSTLFSGESKRKKESDDPMFDCGILYVVSSINDARSEKRIVRNTKIN